MSAKAVDLSDVIRRARYETDAINIAFSCGKDSVHAESKVWVRRGDNVMHVPIGELVQCVEAQVFSMSDGKRIYALREDIDILTFDDRRQRLAQCQWFPIRYLSEHPHKDDLYEFRLRGGRTIRTTGHHSVMLCKAGSNGTEAYEAKASEVIVGDSMLTAEDLCFDVPDNPNFEDWFIRLAGLWIADGCYAVGRKIIISTGNMPEMIGFLRHIPRQKSNSERALEYYESVRPDHDSDDAAWRDTLLNSGINYSTVHNAHYRGVGRRHKYSKIKVLPNGDVWLCDSRLVKKMRFLGLVGTSHTKKVPDWVFSLSRRQVGLFLAGYFDGDGCFHDQGITATTVSKSLAEGIRILCNRIGARCTVSSKSGKIGGFRTSTANVYFVGMASGMAYSAFRRWVPSWKKVVGESRCGYASASRQVVSISRVPSGGVVYDVQVDGENTFIADGVLVHNSIVLLDLCHKWFRSIAAFHMYTVPDISFHQQYIRFAEKRFAKKLVCPIVQVPHWGLSKQLQVAAMRPDNLPSENIPTIRVRDIEVAVRKKTGIQWFAWGQKKRDSLERRAMLNKCSGVDIGSSRCYPLSEWSDRAVIEYLKEKKIPLSADYGWPGANFRSYGGHLEGEYLSLLKENSPADYERVLEVFPYAAAEVYRWEQGMKGGPRVRGTKDQPRSSERSSEG